MGLRFDYRSLYRSTRTPVIAPNMGATSHPRAVQAGLRMMTAGGNAVDYVEMDGAALLASDVATGVVVDHGTCVYPPAAGTGAQLL
mgnify:CR=1 FL=1